MPVIDRDKFITYLVYSGVVDKATCGELKEAIELCTVKDIYTKADMVATIDKIEAEIKKEADTSGRLHGISEIGLRKALKIIDKHKTETGDKEDLDG